jgi:hypothetical protein
VQWQRRDDVEIYFEGMKSVSIMMVMMMMMIIIQIVGFKEEDKLQVPRSYAFIGTAKDSDNLSDGKRCCQSITLAHGFHPSSKQEQTPGLNSCTVIRRTQCFVTAVRDTALTEKHRVLFAE